MFSMIMEQVKANYTSSKIAAQATLLISCALVGSFQDCYAQPSSGVASVQSRFAGAPNASAPAYNTKPLRRYNGGQNYMYQTLELKSPVSVPFLPAYRGLGASYSTGVYYPKLKARQCYVMRFNCKDSSNEVMRSYKESLITNGWQVNESQTNTKQMTATKKDSGLYLTLCVYPTSSKPEYRSSFEIKYLSAGAVQAAN